MLRSLQHVGIAVPDIEVGRAFYMAFGLEAQPRADGLAFRCFGRAQDQVRLLEGPRKRLHHVSFGTAASELPVLKRRVERQGVGLLPAPAEDDAEEIWFRDPDGDLVNVRVAEAGQQTRPAAVPVNSPGDYRRFGVRGAAMEGHPVQPRRLGHLIKFSPDVLRLAAFYIDVLGMRLSDKVSDKIAFLRCAGGGDHHVLGIALAPGTGLHHLSFEVDSVDAIEQGAQNLIGLGYRDGWGLGRHLIGSNYFHYVRDPWMSMAEYFWDIDVIPDGANWEPADVPLGPKAVAQWATSPMPEDFIRNYELA